MPLLVSSAVSARAAAEDRLRRARGPGRARPRRRRPDHAAAPGRSRPAVATTRTDCDGRGPTTERPGPRRAHALLLRGARHRQRCLGPEGASRPRQRPPGVLGRAGLLRAGPRRRHPGRGEHRPSGSGCCLGVRYYIDNMFQPEYHRKAAGPGARARPSTATRSSRWAVPHWRNLRLSEAQIDSYRRRAADWDYLVSPARYATPLLTRDFGYDGEVLEIGYPRNDVLKSAGGRRHPGRRAGVARHRGRCHGCALRADLPRLPRRGRQRAR